MTISEIAKSLSGKWYNQTIYYKFRIHQKHPWQRGLARLFFMPVDLIMRLNETVLRRMELPHVEMTVTTRCTLRCRDCVNLLPFNKHHFDFSLELLKREVEDLLANVDHIHRFIILGGETFLYRELVGLLEHLIAQNKLGLVNLYTNGSIIPKPEVLRLLQHRKILVTVSNYPLDVTPNRSRLICTLEAYHINHRLINDQWRDFGGFYPEVDNRETSLKCRYINCGNKIYHCILDGEFYLCPRSMLGWRMGQFPKNESDSITYRGKNNPRVFKRDLQRLMRKEYLLACTKCKGYDGDNQLPPAVQLDRAVCSHTTPPPSDIEAVIR